VQLALLLHVTLAEQVGVVPAVVLGVVDVLQCEAVAQRGAVTTLYAGHASVEGRDQLAHPRPAGRVLLAAVLALDDVHVDRQGDASRNDGRTSRLTTDRRVSAGGRAARSLAVTGVVSA
jgi:hypothetical protein